MDEKVDDTSLDDLEKTTDLLRQFEPRISKEEKTEDLANLFPEEIRNSITFDYRKETSTAPIYQDVTLLESTDTSVIEEKVDEIKGVSKNTIDSVEEQNLLFQENNERNHREIGKKRYGKILMLISSVLITGLLLLLVVEGHSNLFMNKSLEGLFIALLGVFIFLFFFGIHLYLKNRKQEPICSKKKWINR